MILNSKWKVNLLDEIASSIDYGHTASANSEEIGPKFLRITDIQNSRVDWNSVPFCNCSEAELKRYNLSDGDIVFARTGATTGKSFLIENCPDKSVFASYLIRVRPNSQVFPKYLFHFFQTDNYWRQVYSRSTGTAQAGVNATKLASLKIPLPPLDEQKRIAAVLDKADALREKRRAAITKLDELLQSVFLDMFGDPVSNPKGWESVKIGSSVFRILTCNPSIRNEDTFEYIDISSIDREAKKIIGTNQIDSNNAPSRARQIVKDGDILVSTVRPNLNAVAQVKPEFDEAIASTGFTVLRPNDGIIKSHYLFEWVKSPQFISEMIEKATGASYPAVSDRIIKDSEVLLPPIELQEKFSIAVQKIEQNKMQFQESVKKSDILFQSLQQRAFAGELFGAANDEIDLLKNAAAD